jgi:hypothetical protein
MNRAIPDATACRLTHRSLRVAEQTPRSAYPSSYQYDWQDIARLKFQLAGYRRAEFGRSFGEAGARHAAAEQLLGLERRIEGPTGLISKRRGRTSNRRKPEELRRVPIGNEPTPTNP